MVKRYCLQVDSETESPYGPWLKASDYDALQAKHDNLAWNLDGCMESINNLSAQKDTLVAEMNAWFKDEAKFYGLPYDGERKSSVAKLGDRIRALEEELAEANAGRDKLIIRDVESALRISALEAALLRHGHKDGSCGLCAALETNGVI